MKLSILTITLLLVLCRAQFTDKTRIPQARGSDVVEAVVSIIRNSCLFPNDRLYLRRLAYVETQDGLAASTFRPGYYGGIWQVDEAMFRLTKTDSSLNDARQRLKSTMGIDWAAVRWQDLTKPLYSGLAAAMYTYIMTGGRGRNIPAGIEYQAVFWKNTTRPGEEVSVFYNAANKLATGCTRTDNLDLAFVVDSSASLSSKDFDAAKQFIGNVLGVFDIARNATQVAVVKFSTQVEPEFNFLAHPDKSGVLNAVNNMRYSPGGTHTAEALNYTVFRIFSEFEGARRGSAKVLILITDGRSENKLETISQAAKAKNQGISVFTIGVTDQVDKEELNAVSSIPTCTHVQILNAFSDLDSLKAEIQQVSCKAPAVLTANNYTYPCGTDVNVQILPNVTAGSTVRVTVSDGSVTIYGSVTFSTASPVLNEFSRVAEVRAPMSFYVSGNDSVALAFVSSSAGSCVSNFNVQVEPGVTLRPDSHALCLQNRVIQNCSVNVLPQSPNLIVPIGLGFANPCDPAVGHVQIFVFPNRNDRFIYCDRVGNPFIVLCPLGDVYEPSFQACVPGQLSILTTPSTTLLPLTTPTTPQPITITPSPSPGTLLNPCTAENILNGRFFFEYPGNDQVYIECYNIPNVARVKSCPDHHYWSQTHLTCLYRDVVVDPTKDTYHPGQSNPCGTIPNLFFYSIPGDNTRYIHCDNFGDAFEKQCPDAKVWRQDILQCVPSGLVITDTKIPDIPNPQLGG